MHDDKVRRIADEALERLAKALEAGKSEVLQDYLAAQARFHRYSWNNVLLINSQRPDATRVAGYHAWHELGRYVKKGERGIMIYAPVVVKDRQPQKDPAGKDAMKLSGFRTAYVFDVDQTHGKPLAEFAKTTGDPAVFTDRLKAIVEARGIALSYDRSIAPAHGVSTGGQIRVLPGLTRAEEFAVIAHELAHEMLHHGPHRPSSRTLLETQAEAVSFVVSRAAGLEGHSAAADYIHLYNGDKKTLEESLSAIHDASTRILKDLLPEERRSVADSSREIERELETLEHGPSGSSPTVQNLADQSDSIALDR